MRMTSLDVWFLWEVMSFCGVVTFAVFMNSMIRQRVETQVPGACIQKDLSAHALTYHSAQTRMRKVCSFSIIFPIIFHTPQVHCDSVAEELSAAGSLLRVTCDAVIELDPKLCLTNHSPELSAMLLRDRPGSTLRGKSFLELMPPEEAIYKFVETSVGKKKNGGAFGDFWVLVLFSTEL